MAGGGHRGEVGPCRGSGCEATGRVGGDALVCSPREDADENFVGVELVRRAVLVAAHFVGDDEEVVGAGAAGEPDVELGQAGAGGGDGVGRLHRDALGSCLGDGVAELEVLGGVGERNCDGGAGVAAPQPDARSSSGAFDHPAVAVLDPAGVAGHQASRVAACDGDVADSDGGGAFTHDGFAGFAGGGAAGGDLGVDLLHERAGGSRQGGGSL